MQRVAMLVTAALMLSLGVGCQSRKARVLASGSSTVYPVTEAMAEGFGKQQSVRVTVGLTGTGGGFKKFCAGEIDICNASRPIKTSEVGACAQGRVQYVEIPVAYDGIVVVVNPQNTWANDITVDELKKLWEPSAQNKITRWNQIRPSWPDKEIHLYGPGVDSGTYDYFTQAIVHQEHASRGDYTASADPNILVNGVSGDPLSLAFFSMVYYQENKGQLKPLGLINSSAKTGATTAAAVLPSVETVRNNTYQPLSRPVFIYVAAKSLDRPEVKRFVDYYLENAPEVAAKTGYIALSSKAYQLDKERVNQRKVGSIFKDANPQTGMSIDVLLEQSHQ